MKCVKETSILKDSQSALKMQPCTNLPFLLAEWCITSRCLWITALLPSLHSPIGLNWPMLVFSLLSFIATKDRIVSHRAALALMRIVQYGSENKVLSVSNRPFLGVVLLADFLAWIIAVWVPPIQQIPPSHSVEKVVVFVCVSTSCRLKQFLAKRVKAERYQ